MKITNPWKLKINYRGYLIEYQLWQNLPIKILNKGITQPTPHFHLMGIDKMLETIYSMIISKKSYYKIKEI